jgi:hypothetical protein
MICGKFTDLRPGCNCMIHYNSPFPGGEVEGFVLVDIRKDIILFCIKLHGKIRLLLSSMINTINKYSIIVPTAKNSGIYTMVTPPPPKQQTKVGLQKGTENAAEPICCPVLRDDDKYFGVNLVIKFLSRSLSLSFHTPSTSRRCNRNKKDR